jgi:hypothetical protein
MLYKNENGENEEGNGNIYSEDVNGIALLGSDDKEKCNKGTERRM